jgi:hypothetical protein
MREKENYLPVFIRTRTKSQESQESQEEIDFNTNI